MNSIKTKSIKTMLLSSLLCAMAAFPTIATVEVIEEGINTMLKSTIDLVFLFFSVGIATIGALQLISAIIHFIHASLPERQTAKGHDSAVVAAACGNVGNLLSCPSFPQQRVSKN